jgi:hypothetical protein
MSATVTVLVCLLVVSLVLLVTICVTIYVKLSVPAQDPLTVGKGAVKQDPEEFPRLLHVIYIPWDKSTQKLKANQIDFDHTWYENLQQTYENTTWTTKLWSLSEIEELVTTIFSTELWEFLMTNTTRPTQLVDFARFAIVYAHGGVYIQYGYNRSDIDSVIPTNSGTCFLTESVLSPLKQMTMHRIQHDGQFEHPIRIANQLFGAFPRSTFIKEFILQSIINIRTIPVKNDYDVLYVGANALLSKTYHSSRTCDYELVGRKESSRIEGKKLNSGSWRGSACPWSQTPPKPTVSHMSVVEAMQLLGEETK